MFHKTLKMFGKIPKMFLENLKMFCETLKVLCKLLKYVPPCTQLLISYHHIYGMHLKLTLEVLFDKI